MDMSLPITTDFDIAPARVTIDTGAIVANWKTLARLCGGSETSAVLKADAYGLGAAPVASALAAAGCQTFFVATVSEGVSLRTLLPGVRIFVLAGLWSGWEEAVFDNGLIPVLASGEQVAFFRSLGGSHPFALQFDTGMNRMGLDANEAPALGESPARPVMVMSHMACSDDADHPLNWRQLDVFQGIASHFESVQASLASSGGVFLGPDYHFDLTRPGIALYGGEPLNGIANPMQPVVTAEARILQIRSVAAGEKVSYGATHTLSRDSVVAVVGAGYADGWHRALSGSGVALRETRRKGAEGMVAGRRVPVIGRITMDLTMFDLTDVPAGDVRIGDYVSLFGNGITLDEAARSAGTISYELLTSLGARYARRYL